ncbi:class I SAM-dependent methyltransferase [Bisgaard Taxon 46]
MNSKIDPNKISGLSSTLLITLWAKAVEYNKPEPIIRDAEAARLLKLIDYDFSKFKSASLSQIGCCGRAKLFDQEILKFIHQHPDAVVVQLGAGLDARFERLGKPQVTAWYDLDLPDVIALRRELLPESCNHYLADSLFNTSWMETVAIHNKPVLLILEGVLMYFSKPHVKTFLIKVAKKLPHSTMIFDIVPPFAVGRAKYHDALKSIDNKARPEFSWSIENVNELTTWHPSIKLLAAYQLSEFCQDYYPWWVRLIYRTNWGKTHFDQRIVVVKLS